jgi:hypothetical protein
MKLQEEVCYWTSVAFTPEKPLGHAGSTDPWLNATKLQEEVCYWTSVAFSGRREG